MEDELLSDIRLALNKGMALGNERFKSEIETLSGRRVTDGEQYSSIYCYAQPHPRHYQNRRGRPPCLPW